MINRRSWVLLAIPALCFGTYLAIASAHAGIYADDANFYRNFLLTDMAGKAQLFWGYVPGRNLHILWQHLGYAASVWTPGDFTGHHVLQSFIVALNAWLLGVLLIRLRVRLVLAALTMLIFCLWPIYAEAYLWVNSLPQHIASTTLVLAMLHAMVWSWNRPARWMPVISVLTGYLLATFTYDQAASACLLLIVAWLLAMSLRAQRTGTWQTWLAKGVAGLATALVTTAVYVYLIIEVRPSATGPVVISGLGDRVVAGLASFATSVGLAEGEPRIVDGFWLVALAYLLRGLFILAIVMLGITLLSDRANPERAAARSRARWWLVLVGIALAAAVAAYGPAWAWAVALRHTYFPIMFVCLAYGLAFEGLLESTAERIRKAVAAITIVAMAATCVLAAFALADQVRAWNERAELRQAVYQRVADLVASEPNGRDKCVKFVAVDIFDYAIPFNYETMIAALNILARDPYNTVSCSGEWIPEETGCAEGFFPRTDPSVSYIAFPYNPDGSRNWLGATVALRCL